MQKIIPPVPLNLIKEELKEEFKMRKTNRGSNYIYYFKASQAPNIMREVGRLREEAFRFYGGGSGKEIDLDEYDTEDIYTQMIVWDPEDEKIVGGYRYICGSDVELDKNGEPILASSSMFHFTEPFIRNYLPFIIELGRSFVSLDYQATRPDVKPNRKGLFALDNLWDGLGGLILMYPQNKYFFGKVTMYKGYNRFCRDILVYLMMKHYSDKERLVYPKEPIPYNTDEKQLAALLPHETFKEDYKEANRIIRRFGINIPPLVNTYIQLSEDMLVFGPAVNYHFSEVEETAILVPFSKIEKKKKARHIESFLRDCAIALRGKLIELRGEIENPELN